MSQLQTELSRVDSIHVHWIDNFQRYHIMIYIFSRCLSRNSLFINRELYASLAWTAHGVKLWDRPGNVNYRIRDGTPVPAMPELEDIFDERGLCNLIDRLVALPIFQYEDSLTFSRDVRRVPLKIQSDIEAELKHQEKSYDGLTQFFPLDIYDSNISCTSGLLKGLERVQRIDGFGKEDSVRASSYSILLVDIAIYWQLFRILYSFTGLAPIRQDLFMCLGLWHTYAHANRLIWTEFRSTFLAPAWFTLFPDETLLFKPKLLQSTTFFLYLSLSYKVWRPSLVESISRVKQLLISEQFDFLSSLGGKASMKKPPNPCFR